MAELAGLPALADDSGLCVDALGGAPGIYTARFGGDIPQTEKNALLLRTLAETGSADRSARFVSAICLAYPDGSCVEAEGTCEGSILLEQTALATIRFLPISGADRSANCPRKRKTASRTARRRLLHLRKNCGCFERQCEG